MTCPISRVGVLLLAAMLAACVAPLQPTRPTPDQGIVASKEAPSFRLERFRWRGEIGGLDSVSAVNHWGDLRTRTADGDELFVSAMIQKIGSDRDELGIRVERVGQSVEVTVVPRVAEPRGRVDLTLMVPAGRQLEAATAGGFAELKYRGDVRAQTVEGDIYIKTSAAVQARSESGSITARLTHPASRQAASLVSESGDITVAVPGGAEHLSFEPRIYSGSGQVRVVDGR